MKERLKSWLRRKLEVPDRRDVMRDVAMLLRGCDVRSIVDVGANVGNVSAELRAMFPGAEITAFEPTPSTFKKLTERGLERVRCLPYACGAAPGEAEIIEYPTSGSNSILPFTAEPYHRSKDTGVRSRVEVVRIDDHVERCDVLKLDIQGFELPALRGAQRILRDTLLIRSEIAFRPTYLGGTHFDELSVWLRERGFGVFGFYSVFGGSDGQWTFGDAIFISESLRKSLPKEAYQSARYV